MNLNPSRSSPGRIRDAILHIMSQSSTALTVKDLEMRVSMILGPTPSSSIRSYLRLNTPDVFVREDRGLYRLRNGANPRFEYNSVKKKQWEPPFRFKKSTLFHSD